MVPMRKLAEYTLADIFRDSWPLNRPRELRILTGLRTHPDVSEIIEAARRAEWRRWESEQAVSVDA